MPHWILNLRLPALIFHLTLDCSLRNWFDKWDLLYQKNHWLTLTPMGWFPPKKVYPVKRFVIPAWNTKSLDQRQRVKRTIWLQLQDCPLFLGQNEFCFRFFVYTRVKQRLPSLTHPLATTADPLKIRLTSCFNNFIPEGAFRKIWLNSIDFFSKDRIREESLIR